MEDLGIFCFRNPLLRFCYSKQLIHLQLQSCLKHEPQEVDQGEQGTYSLLEVEFQLEELYSPEQGEVQEEGHSHLHPHLLCFHSRIAVGHYRRIVADRTVADPRKLGSFAGTSADSLVLV